MAGRWRRTRPTARRPKAHRFQAGHRRGPPDARAGRSRAGKCASTGSPVAGDHRLGEMKSRGFGRPTTTAHCELFFDGNPMTLARWPTKGRSRRSPDSRRPRPRAMIMAAKLGNSKTASTIAVTGPDGGRTRAVFGRWLLGLGLGELVRTGHVSRSRPARGPTATARSVRLPPGSPTPLLLNVLEEIDQPGEWFLDRKSGVLYFWPPTSAGEARTIQRLHPSRKSSSLCSTNHCSGSRTSRTSPFAV